MLDARRYLDQQISSSVLKGNDLRVFYFQFGPFELGARIRALTSAGQRAQH